MAYVEYISQSLSSSADVSNYESLILNVLDQISNKKRLLSILKDMQTKVSSYDYEKLDFIFRLIAHLDDQDTIAVRGIAILKILSTFQRIHPPTPDEYQSVRSPVGALEGLDSISKNTSNHFASSPTHASAQLHPSLFSSSHHRFPYHDFILRPWHWLERELKVESINQLSPLATPLSIDIDQFYVVVVQNILTGGKRLFLGCDH